MVIIFYKNIILINLKTVNYIYKKLIVVKLDNNNCDSLFLTYNNPNIIFNIYFS